MKTSRQLDMFNIKGRGKLSGTYKCRCCGDWSNDKYKILWREANKSIKE